MAEDSARPPHEGVLGKDVICWFMGRPPIVFQLIIWILARYLCARCPISDRGHGSQGSQAELILYSQPLMFGKAVRGTQLGGREGAQVRVCGGAGDRSSYPGGIRSCSEACAAEARLPFSSARRASPMRPVSGSKSFRYSRTNVQGNCIFDLVVANDGPTANPEYLRRLNRTEPHRTEELHSIESLVETRQLSHRPSTSHWTFDGMKLMA